MSPFPQGLFMPPKNTPQIFSAAKMLFRLGKHTLIAPIPTYVGICVSPFPRGLLCLPKHAPRCFCVAEMLFGGNRAAGAGGTSRRSWGNRPLTRHQPIPLEKVRTPKASLVGEKSEGCIWKIPCCVIYFCFKFFVALLAFGSNRHFFQEEQPY